MTTLVGQLAPALLALVAGWIVLLPQRASLGVAYHLVSPAVGLVVFSLAAAVSSVLGRPMDALTIVVAIALGSALTWATARVAPDGDRAGVPASGRSYAVTVVSIIVLGAVFTLGQVTVATNDALVQFWPMSLGLLRGEGLTDVLMSSRSVLIPALGAVHALAGADWAYASYPLIAANVVALLIWALREGCGTSVPKKACAAIVLGSAIFLITEPSFLFHSVFVHSHMISALYLLVALVSLWFARAGIEDGAGTPAGSWLTVAGLAAAGVVLTRPDGLAYVFVVVAAAISVLTLGRFSWRPVLAFFVPLLGVTVFVHLAAFLQVGSWGSGKLSGLFAFGLLALLAVASAAPWIVARLATVLPVRIRGESFMTLAVALASAALVGVAVLKPEDMLTALSNAAVNLFGGAGGYGPLWYAVAAFLLFSVIAGDATREGSVTRLLFFTIVLYFIVSTVIHGGTHVGRVGDLDSFTRVAFQVLPLFVWYAGAVMTRIAREWPAHQQ